MKVATSVLLTACLFSHPLLADTEQYDPETARAYQGYLLTFSWPEGQSTEQVNYVDLLPAALGLLINNKQQASEKESPLDLQLDSPFVAMENKLKRRVDILANQEWTLIFKAPGDSIRKQFTHYSEAFGYPELTADVAIKLGRYLETDIRYQHYLFSRNALQNTVSSSQDDTPDQSASLDVTDSNITLLKAPEQTSTSIELPNLAINDEAFVPSAVLTLYQSNKTASKKVNYLDHPTIGTLLYFEPIELEDAFERIALKTMTPETGASLNYDELQSTNELYSR